MKTALAMILFAALGLSTSAMAEGDELMKACKAECPNAKTEHETHACLKKVAVKKKDDAKWKAGACNKALVAHEAHEKEHGHDEGDHKH